MNTADAAGRQAEELAARYLEQKGYQIVARRFRSRQGEIDLIARQQGVIVFVEVKYRRTTQWGRPALSVSAAKIRRIQQTALYYLRQSRQSDVCCRFDVIELWQEQGRYKIHHYENAFEGASYGI